MKTQKIISKSPLTFILAILILSNVVLAYFVFYLNSAIMDLNNFKFNNSIIMSGNSLLRNPEVDIQTGKRHLVMARLVLPKETQKDDAIYYHGDNATIYLSSVNNVDSKKNLAAINTNPDEFNTLPDLQTCARQVMLTFEREQDDQDYKFEFEKSLSDGRTAYFHILDSCPEDVTPLLNQLKQIDSY